MTQRIVLMFVLFLFGVSQAAAEGEDRKVWDVPEINGVAFGGDEKSELLVASYHGLHTVAPDGTISLVAEPPGAISEFIAVPGEDQTFLASGYKSKTEKLGLIRTEDGGKSWRKVSKDSDLVFYSLAIGEEDTELVYGADVEQGLMISRDGGETWSAVSTAPGEIFDLAVDLTNSQIVFAATNKGLFKSIDAAETWMRIHSEKKSATMVEVDEGRVYAYIHNYGLILAKEKSPDWITLSNNFDSIPVMNLAIDPKNWNHLVANVSSGVVVVSQDGGVTWTSYEGHQDATPQRIAQGQTLYTENCQSCHGVKGAGVQDDGKWLAPPLDSSAHAWHHPDEQLIDTILNGAPPPGTMPAWKDHGLVRDDAQSLVAYIKSLWNFTSVACQGARHMSC